ncbi:MAG: ADP-ribosylglycohydrolase family protein [Verrucomicrobiota bacterium]|nr:ADP-ribosylglycohydrolase family protein [Verrucomicrobiota bacterium]MEC8279433.1 ADP-ribosylglycohydrolase family protein [Verrucomicrobiota bacterium]
MLGSLAADALAMPVHWYYDTQKLDRDYGRLTSYVAPQNPHSDSILWRSRYIPRNARGNILHDQIKYWGQRDIHYHQFLAAGENTINYQLGKELYLTILEHGVYDSDKWLERYIECMLDGGWHKDTYLEEYHRAFFDNYAKGLAPIDCGIDDLHIGGLSHVPCLLSGLTEIGVVDLDEQLLQVEKHVRLTHRNQHVSDAAAAMTHILYSLREGLDLRKALDSHAKPWASSGQFDTWTHFSDRTVIGRQLTMACYLPESFTASLYLCWKYAEDFSAGIIANAYCGGDNCHRGAVVGALLGAANGAPKKWIQGLIDVPF